MRNKVIMGLLIFIAGILLDVVSEIADVWIIGVFGHVLWPIGMVIGINSLVFFNHENKDTDSTLQSTKAKKAEKDIERTD